ncbi:hypothetical protein ACT3J6_21540, partial [Mycobacterium tuberculosis]
SLSTTFGCPFEGEVPEARVHELTERLLAIGVQGVTLCDTTGMADPAQVERICREALQRWPEAVFTAHFHNTRGMGLANALAALNAGIDRFDASLEPGWAEMTASGLAQWGPPATADFLGVAPGKESLRELLSMTTALRSDNEFD